MKRGSFIVIPVILFLAMAGCKGSGKLEIKSVEPREAKANQPAMLDIKGSGFVPGAKVKLGDRESPQVAVAGPERIIALLPENLPPGALELAVEIPGGQRATLPAAVQVTSSLSLVAVAPAFLNQGQTAELRLEGLGFSTGIKVFMNDLPAPAEVKSDRLIVVTPPALAPGYVAIRLEAPDGGRAQLDGAFQILSAGGQLSVSPMKEEAAKWGLTAPDMVNRTGIAAADFNRDGILDLAITGAYEIRILLGGPDGFKDVTAASNVKTTGVTYGPYPADFDNDGLPDLLISGQPGRLYHNLGDGKFEDVTLRVGLPADFNCWSAAWGDYDADGLIDLFLGSTNQEDALFHNVGGKFVEVFSDRWHKMETAKKYDNRQATTFSEAFGDYDNDGFVDLFVGVRGQPSGLFHNLAGKDLVEASAQAGLGPSAGQDFKINWGVSWVDFDNDGFLDLFSASGPTDANLYRNLGGKTFTDVTAGMGINFTHSSLCPAWGDLDNDGWLDLALTDNENGLHVYRNRGDGSFTDVTAELGTLVDTLVTPMSVLWIDVNGDGALDLYCAGFSSPSHLFLNTPYPGRHWLQVSLKGAKSNAMGIGAMVTVEVGARKLMQQVAGGSGYLMSPPPVLHFGLGGETVVSKVTVRWPGGSTQSVEQVKADQRLEIAEPGEPHRVKLPPAPAAPAPASGSAPAKPAK